MGFQLIVHLKNARRQQTRSLRPIFRISRARTSALKTNAREEEATRGERRNMLPHKGRKGPPLLRSTACSRNTRVHISISAMHDKTPGWTRDDKNEEELLSHSNRAIFGSSLRQCRAIFITCININKWRCKVC